MWDVKTISRINDDAVNRAIYETALKNQQHARAQVKQLRDGIQAALDWLQGNADWSSHDIAADMDTAALILEEVLEATKPAPVKTDDCGCH